MSGALVAARFKVEAISGKNKFKRLLAKQRVDARGALARVLGG